MNNHTPFAKEIAAFPAALRELIEAELAAGNRVVEVSSTFPAPQCGAYAKLEKPVTTRPREAGCGLKFVDRNWLSYTGEFSDDLGHFFVLEPPRPPEMEADMNAIREEMAARCRAADAERFDRDRH